MARSILSAWCFLLSASTAKGQIKVMAPPWLKSSIQNQGAIEGSTATFGAPFYGDDVVGKLVYGESKGNAHCTDEDYDFPQAETGTRGNSQYQEVKLINIAVVRRGKCSFTTKAKVAYQKGAHAVIVVDGEDSSMSTADVKNVIVGDDGFGGSIHIPSILIAKQEGQKLIDAAMKTHVVVQLAWDVPADHIVGIDLWMSAGSIESMQFLKNFAKARRALNEVMHFTPHYHVFGMPSDDPSVFQGLCSDTDGKFCAEDPDTAGPITGKNVLEEDLRQLCIHELTQVPVEVREEHAAAAAAAAEQTTAEAAKVSGKGGKGGDFLKKVLTTPKPGPMTIMYAEPYWAYVEKIADRCPIGAPDESGRFGYACSQKLMEEVGIDAAKVNRCASDTKDQKLKDQRDHAAWSPRALRINGWRYNGMMDPDLVTRAVCAGFTIKPAECQTLVSERDPFATYTGAASEILEVPVSNATFFGGIMGLAVVTLSMFCCYKSAIKEQVQGRVREEVMLEVQSAMAQYSRMHGGDQ